MTSPPQGPTNGPPPGPQWGPIPTSGLPPAQRPPKKRRKWPWIAAGVVLALLVIAGIASANSPKPTSATLASPTLTNAHHRDIGARRRLPHYRCLRLDTTDNYRVTYDVYSTAAPDNRAPDTVANDNRAHHP